MSKLISPSGLFALGWLHKPRASKARPSEEPGYFCRVLFTDAALASPAWKNIDAALDDAGRQHFGKEYDALRKRNGLRLPLRRDIAGKGYPADYVAFLNLNAKSEWQPAVVGTDSLPIMDQAEIYPGCIIRVSLRIYAYGGKGSSFSPGINFGFEAVQKLKDGPRLAGGRSDGSEFGGLPTDELEDMLA